MSDSDTTAKPAGETRDLIILGGGLVGMTLALAAARAGITSHVIDRADPADLVAEGADGRASAISTASWNLFANIGLAGRLAPLGCPIDSIAVTDGMKPGRLDFAPKPEEGSLGRMFFNRDLRLALFDAAKTEPAIAWHVRTEAVRRDRAMVTGLFHEKPHGNTAWEIFYPAGPFALLPLLDDDHGRHRSALVWTVAEKDAAGVIAMNDAMFVNEVAARMHGVLGAIELSAPRMSYPLRFHHAGKVIGDRLAVIGDAAHGMHPIAGQGLNLGLRDVGALVEVLSEGMRLGLEPGDAQLLARYEKWRSLDAFMVMSVTDGLTRLFGVPGRLPSAVRRLGMGAIQRMPPLKRFFMDEARGVSGKLPALLRG